MSERQYIASFLFSEIILPSPGDSPSQLVPDKQDITWMLERLAWAILSQDSEQNIRDL